MTEGVVLSVDMIRCDGHGICAWFAPDHIDLDEWGFPIVEPAPIETSEDISAARRAVRACPRRALSLGARP